MVIEHLFSARPEKEARKSIFGRELRYQIVTQSKRLKSNRNRLYYSYLRTSA